MSDGSGFGILDRICGMRHPVLFLLAVGIVIRLIVMSTSMVYDLDYWAVVVRNIEAGNNLYDAEGYYYTPVWGYILGIVAAFQTMFLDLGELAVRVVEVLPVEGIPLTYYTANAPTIAFIYSVKFPLMISDIALSLLAALLVEEHTGDRRKAVAAFGLTFLCPVLILSSAMIAMPDTIAVLFAVLTVVLLRRRMYFLAGATFCLAVLTKFFPAFFIFLFVAYVLAVHRGDAHKGALRVGEAALGAVVVACVVFAPQLIEGNIEQCFQFLTDRTSTVVGGTWLDTVSSATRILAYLAVLVASALVGWHLCHRADRDPDEMLLKGCLLVSALCLVYPPTTQYMVIMVPFLAIWAAACEGKYMLSWKIIAVGSIIYVYASNALTVMPLAVWTDLVSVEAVMAFFNWYDTPLFGSVSMRSLQFVVGGVIQCLGVVSVLYLMFGDRIRAKTKGGALHQADV